MLAELADQLFVAESTIRFYGVRLQTRMAVVRLPDGRLLLYSPVQPTPRLREQLAGLGSVAFVLSPNKIHNQTLAACREAFPEAKLWAPPGLPERRPELRFDGVVDGAPPPEWGGELDLALTAGNVFFSEVLLLHRRSRTLLVGDLVENIDASTVSRLGRLLAAPFGVRSRPAPSPEFRLYTHDAEAAARALDRPRGWSFDRIFLCHGGLIEERAREVFDAVCEELIAAARARGPVGRWLFRRLAAIQ